MGFFSEFPASIGIGRASVEQSAPEVRSDEPTTPPETPELVIATRADFNYKVTPIEALGFVPINRAAGVITTALMQLSLDAYRNGEALDKATMEPRLRGLITQPDVDTNLPIFLEQTGYSLVGWANAFWRVFRDSQGRTTGLRVLNPTEVEIELDSFGFVKAYQWKGKSWTNKEIQHLAVGRIPGEAKGRGPIQLCQAEIRGMLDLRDYSAHWFQESGVPTGILKTEQPLNADQAAEYREQWEKSQGGNRGTAVLGAGLSFAPVYLSPEQAMWLSGRQADTTSVARMFGIHPSLLIAAVEGSSMTYANVSQAWVEFARFTLSRYTVEIEQAFTAVLPRGMEARFNLEALLRPDTASRWAIHTQALASGAMSINEVRGIENMPPIPGGDHKTQAELDAQAAQFEQDSETPAPDEEEAPDDGA